MKQLNLRLTNSKYIFLVMVLFSCNKLDRKLSFPLIENQEEFIIKLLFECYDSLFITSSDGNVTESTRRLTNQFGIDSIVENRIIDNQEIITIKNTLKEIDFKGFRRIEVFNLKYDLIKKSVYFEDYWYDKYNNLIKRCDDDRCISFKTINSGDGSFHVKSSDVPFHWIYTFEDQKLRKVESREDTLVCCLYYNDLGRISRITKTNSLKEREYIFNYKSGNLKSVSLNSRSHKVQYDLNWQDSVLTISNNINGVLNSVFGFEFSSFAKRFIVQDGTSPR